MAVTSEVNDEETPLQGRLDAVATGIGKVGTLIAVIVFIVVFVRNVTSGSGAWYTYLINAFIIGVTIVVVAVPEGLPLAVTLSLAYSMKKMMLDKALVRHLSACEAMGGATAICSDKTGTLTTNRMTVVRAWVGGGLSPPDRPAAAADVPSAAHALLQQAVFLNTTGAVAKTPSGELEFAGSPTEKALLAFACLLPGLPGFADARARAPLLHMQPFNSAKKTMGVAVRVGGSASTRVYWKGASEIVLAACDHELRPDGATRPLTPEARAQLSQLIDEFARAALRTLCVAYVDLPPSVVPDWEGGLPFEGLTLAALVGIKDPCRPGVPQAVAACQAAGIVVRMVTGDNVATARAIASECGIFDAAAGHVAMEGPAFRVMPHSELVPLLPRLRVLARSSPTDKHTLVALLRSLGEVVAVTGDGTNDAPALHEADIGLAMGIAGTEVAKEASDIIILDDDFASCVRVVRWGRSVYRNIQAFLQFQLTVNVVALLLNMICALIGGEVPLTAVQLLWVNLIMDTMGALALATEPPRESLMLRKPYGRTEAIISNAMWRNILVMATFQLIVLFTLFFAGCSLLGFGDSQLTSSNCGSFPTTLVNGKSVCYDRSHGCPPKKDVNGNAFSSTELIKFDDYITLTTTIFNSFVFMQVFNEINARNMEDLNVFRARVQARARVCRWLTRHTIAGAARQQDILLHHSVHGWRAVPHRLVCGLFCPNGWAQLAGAPTHSRPRPHPFVLTSLHPQHWILSIVIGFTTMPVALLAKLIRVPETPSLPTVLLPAWCFKRPAADVDVTAPEGNGAAVRDMELGALPTVAEEAATVPKAGRRNTLEVDAAADVQRLDSRLLPHNGSPLPSPRTPQSP